MVVRDVQNITMIGNNKSYHITCAESVRIIVLNVINFRIDNILLFFNSTPECTKASGLQTLTSCTYDVSVVLYQCISVVINKTEIRNTAGIAGIAAVNIMGNSIISKLTIIINCTICPENPVQINGIVVHWVG